MDTKKTTQVELLRLVQKHNDDPVVKTIVRDIIKEQERARFAIHMARVDLDQALNAVELSVENGHVPTDNHGLINSINIVANHCTSFSYGMTALAGKLKDLGEDINYL